MSPERPSSLSEDLHTAHYDRCVSLFLITQRLGEYLKQVGFEAITRCQPLDDFAAIYSEESDGLFRLTNPDQPIEDSQTYALLLNVPSNVSSPAANEESRRLLIVFEPRPEQGEGGYAMVNFYVDPWPFANDGQPLSIDRLIFNLSDELLAAFNQRSEEVLLLPDAGAHQTPSEDPRCVLCWEEPHSDLVRYWTGDFSAAWTTDPSEAAVYANGDKGFQMGRVLERCKFLIGVPLDTKFDFKLTAYAGLVVERVPNVLHCEQGMTVTALKQLLATWPEFKDDGTPNEVCMLSSDGTSRSVLTAVPLNFRQTEDGRRQWADLLLEP